METLPICVKECLAPSRAAGRLGHMGWQFPHLGDELTPDEQHALAGLLRFWPNLCPDSLVPMTQGDVWVVILLAHFCPPTLAALPLVPVMNTRIFNVCPRGVYNGDSRKRSVFTASAL